jgi:HD-like signal output (HDOD) protein/CheY-like chemotaxis protein
MSKRILFVDDEPNVRHGLQRMLRPMRDQWQMDFVGGAMEALDFLERQTVDVVVTDMRMPGMDGVALLERLVERHPRIVRIVLSGHAERGSLMRAAAVAHQYLSKPCEPDVLRTKVTQAFALSTLLSDARLNELATKLKALPTVSAVYQEVLSELDSPDASAARVADVIERDLSMTAKVLQLANSTFFGSAEHVSTCRDAVELLGLETVKGLILSMEVFFEFERGGQCWYDVDALTRHSARVSRCAHAIARDQGASPQMLSEVATAGMLHDVGKLVLADALGTEYTNALRDRFGGKLAIWQIEQETFGASHAEVGAYLLGLWGLPQTVIAATAWHHRPSESGTCEFSALTAVHAADVIAHRIERRSNPDRPVEPPDKDYLASLALLDALPRWVQLCIRREERDA